MMSTVERPHRDRPLRVATWNLRQGGEPGAWRYLQEQLRPDVALLQEANPRDRRCFGWRPIDEYRRWGSLVITNAGLRALPMPAVKNSAMKSSVPIESISQTYPGAVNGCQVALNASDTLVFISVYVVQESNVAQAVAHRVLSDLFPLLTDPRFKNRIVLAGDLNVSTQLSGMWARHSRSVLDRITSAYGLTNILDGLRAPTERLPGCPCRDEFCNHIRTRQAANSAVPWQTDYVFVSPQLAKRVVEVNVPTDDHPAYDFSDHAPIVVQFDL